MPEETEVLRYHVFADEYDEYFGGSELEEATKHFDALVKDGYGGVRLYENFETYKDGEPTGDIRDGDCLKSHGYWPM